MRVSVESITHPSVATLRGELAVHYVTVHGAHDLDDDDPADFTPPRGGVLVGWSDDEQPAATVSVTPAGEPGTCEWRRFYVAPGHRDSGWPRLLVSAAASLAGELGYRQAQVSTTTAGLRMLTALGIPSRSTEPTRATDRTPGHLTARITLEPGRRVPYRRDHERGGVA